MALERQLLAREVGKRIAARRAHLNLTQEDAAAQVGVTHRAYQRWELGEALPYPRNLQRIAEAFGIEMGELLGNSDGRLAPPTLASQLDRIEAKLDAVLDAVSPAGAPRPEDVERDLERLEAEAQRSASREAGAGASESAEEAG
jgi:transcriptional regulator with XRE-family HTH domain